MYQCIIPPRIFLATGVGFLIVSLVLGWISFSVPDWLQFRERNLAKDSIRNISNVDDDNIEFKKFGLWYKCIFSQDANDFICLLWNKDAPSFVRVAQVLIPFGLSLGCLSLLAAIVGLLSRRTFITAALFAALFAFLSFIFTTIGMTVFANESLVYVERLRTSNNDNPRRWGMWLITPNIVLSFFASLCFVFASIFNWCDYRNMEVTGILNHSADKYAASVFKAPSDSNLTSGMKKIHQYIYSQPISGQDYPNSGFQINGSSSNQNPLGYPAPPSYATPSNQHGSNGIVNPAFQHTPGLFGYSRPPSPLFPHSNMDPFHHRHFVSENSEMEDLPHTGRSRRRSCSRHRSTHRSRSRSPRDDASNRNNPRDSNSNNNGSNNKQQQQQQLQPQFIPIPVPYYQPPAQPPPAPPTAPMQPISQPSSQIANTSSNNTNGNNNTNNKQPMAYVIQPPSKQQFVEEIMQSQPKATSMITYGPAQPSLVVSNPTQPIYTIAYRANNGGNLLGSNIITGAPAATYVTAGGTRFSSLHAVNSDSDNDDRDYRVTSRRRNLKKVSANEAWTWRKL
ncbi:unnamed protein product [Adineta ricciae]|uniref:Uncharacterized protein n=1 Tax=Adineta ricciae TaxID=249248 RepID=A0A813Q3H5_ADIRI|nr:unnamed protein product [Adineta ricciae]